VTTDGIIAPYVAPDREWWPVKPTSPPWMRGRPHVEVARTYLVESGPQLLRAADRATIRASARRRPVAGRRITPGA
jgi:hypothetical protein